MATDNEKDINKKKCRVVIRRPAFSLLINVN